MRKQIMNSLLLSSSTTILILLLGIHTVSHSQYYPKQPPSDYYDSSSPSVSPESRNDNPYFNSRNIQPSYRQRQDGYHQYYNIPYNEQHPKETVKYFGTHANTEQVSPPPSSLASYRRRYSSSSENPFFNSQGIGVEILQGDGMEIVLKDFGGPRGKSEVFRVTNRRKFPGDDHRRFGTVDDNQSGVDKPSPPMDIIVVIYDRPRCEKPNQRLYKQDGKCYNPGNTTPPCGSLMLFYPMEGDSIYGDCDCAINNGIVSRPLAYWRPHDSCYLLYHRGPCNYNEWLILDSFDIPRCAPRSCPQDLEESEHSTRFWFRHRGKCYKTGEHYNSFCSAGQEDWKVYFPLGSSEPKCLKEEPIVPFTRSLLSPVNDLPCKPGHKKMQNGECKRVARFDNDYDY